VANLDRTIRPLGSRDMRLLKTKWPSESERSGLVFPMECAKEDVRPALSYALRSGTSARLALTNLGPTNVSLNGIIGSLSQGWVVHRLIHSAAVTQKKRVLWVTFPWLSRMRLRQPFHIIFASVGSPIAQMRLYRWTDCSSCFISAT
jgi:hypothetical protein